MTKINFNLRNAAMIIACLAAATMMFAACGDDPNDPNNPGNNGGAVQVKINNLPFTSDFNSCMLYIHNTKPVQFYGLAAAHPEIASGMITSDEPVTTLTDSESLTDYKSGDGYIRLRIFGGVTKSGYVYKNFISKNKAEFLGNAINIFDFNTDFEILHDFGGQGILRIEDVPNEYWAGGMQVRIIDYLGAVGADGLPIEEDVADFKPMALARDPQTANETGSASYTDGDWLAIPLEGYRNQQLIDVGFMDYMWSFELTGSRFNQTGSYLVELTDIHNPSESKSYHCRVNANFTNGSATVKWGNIRFIAN